MRPTLISVVAGAVLAVVATLAPPPAATPAATARPDAPIRVLFVGDSMTHGQNASTTYRYWVWREFVRQHVPVTFVGPRTDLAHGSGDIYDHVDRGFEPRHAAQGGSRFSDHLPVAAELTRRYEPDVIVLQLGFNDGRRHSGRRLAGDTDRYLRRVWQVDPDVRFVLGEIPPSGQLPGIARPRNRHTARANELIRHRWADDPRVAISRTRTAAQRPWRTDRHTFDGVHPNATGETLMAHRHAQSLRRLGILPQRVRVFRSVRWHPRIRPRVAVDATGVSVDLGRLGHQAWVHPRQVRVLDTHGEPVAAVPAGGQASVTLPLPPGHYRMQVLVRRVAMTGRTRWVRFEVPEAAGAVPSPA